MSCKVDLDALEKVRAAATQGAWFAVLNHCYCEIRAEHGQIGDMCASNNYGPPEEDVEGNIELSEKNARAAVAIVNAFPALIAELRSLRTQQKLLLEGLAAVEVLIDNSRGVEGLHLNGDIATWGSLRTGGDFEAWLLAFDEALAAARKWEAENA